MLGRKRLFVEREANGRPKRPTVARLKEQERENRLAETATVLCQPHRRLIDADGNMVGGDRDPRRVSALGRFCQRNKCRRELFDAATDYANLRRWWGNAVGRPKGLENQTPRGGEGPSDATVRGWLASYVSIDKALQDSPNGAKRFAAFYKMVIDDADPEPSAYSDEMLTTALLIVARHMGRLSGRQSAFD